MNITGRTQGCGVVWHSSWRLVYIGLVKVHHISLTLIMTCVIHLLTASQIKIKDTVKALVKVANKSQMIIRYILLMDIFVGKEYFHCTREEDTSAIQYGKGAEDQRVRRRFHCFSNLPWFYSGVWTWLQKHGLPLWKTHSLFSFFFSLSECLKEEAFARGWQIFILLHVNLSFRQREIRPQIQCWGKQWWLLHFNGNILCPSVYFYGSLIIFRAGNSGFLFNIGVWVSLRSNFQWIELLNVRIKIILVEVPRIR